MRRDGRVQVLFYKYQFGRNARRCRDSPRVCPYTHAACRASAGLLFMGLNDLWYIHSLKNSP